MTRTFIALALIAGLAACNASANAVSGSAQRGADAATKAIANDDVTGVASTFDDALKAKLTRAQVGLISDKFAKLGAYKGLTQTSEDNTKNEFTYRADFDHGSVNLAVRVDTNGQLSAYRVFPN
jgi:hypothetical protein